MRTFQIWAVLVAAVLLTGCQGYKPRINPSVPELKLDEGQRLEINCTSINEINIEYPETNDETGILASEHSITPGNDDGTYKTIFVRNETVSGDTGWYGCIDAKVDVPDEKNYDDPNASWLYLYVKSNQTGFATDVSLNLFPLLGRSMTLPCRPTSPDLHVVLLKDGLVIDTQNNPKVSFDPKEGFKIDQLELNDGGFYECSIEQDEISASNTFAVQIVRAEGLKKPHITKTGLEFVTAGSSLHINCSLQMSVGQPYVFHWEPPRKSVTSRILPTVSKPISHDVNLVTSQYVEDYVTFDDQGDYECIVQSLNERTSTKQYIHVHDPKEKFINLTSHDRHRHYIINEGQPVTFTGFAQGFPPPTLTWEGPTQDIIPGQNYVIENKIDSSSLKINSVRLEYTGTYSLVASNNFQKERLNFTLTVLGKPIIYLEEVKHFYTFNKKEKFICKIRSNPKPDISWTYIKCETREQMENQENCSIVPLTKYDVHQPSESWTFTDIKVKMDSSGYLMCSGSNSYGNDSAGIVIHISDGVKDAPFGIVELEEKVTIGDDVTIRCTASIYNYTRVDWVDEDSKPVENSTRYSVTFRDTRFTHQTNLTIKNLTEEDQKTYHCLASDFNGFPEQTQYYLNIEEPKRPEIISTNLNNTEIVINTEQAHYFNLSCFFKGMPRPKIVWLQNGEPLKLRNEQYKFYKNNQTLEILYLMESDSGKYSCHIQNRFGSADRFQKIVVKGSERILKIFFATIIGLILAVVVILICCCIKIRREQKMRKRLVQAGLMYFEEGAPDCLNPDIPVDEQAEYLPYDKRWEFPRSKLKLGKQLGCGEFGVVMKAQAYGISPEEPVTTVAVKMVRKNTNNDYIKALSNELKIMVHLGQHLNVVNLLGACTNNIYKKELLVIVEYCRFGNLRNYILRHRESFIDQIDQNTGEIDPSIGRELMTRPTSIGSSSSKVKYAALSFSGSLSETATEYNTGPGSETVVYTADTEGLQGLPNEAFISSGGSQPGWRSNYRGDYKDRNLKPICTQDLVSWAYQVACGMQYLSNRKVLHGDLAARNTLLAENGVVKICDFGLARSMYKDDNYQKKENCLLPVKWMAIESMRDRVFSTQSDVWSFGIVLWEFFSLAQTPYHSMSAEVQYQRLVEGYRLDRPEHATEHIYNIMKQCWKAKPALRPSFLDLVEDLGAMLEEDVKELFQELNTPYVMMNNANQESTDYLTMMSSTDHEALTSPHDYANDSVGNAGYLTVIGEGSDDGSKIFSPTRPSSTPAGSRFQFPSVSDQDASGNVENSDGEDAPMLKLKPQLETDLDEDNYLKPIDVQKKRENFMKEQEVEKKKEKEQSTKSLADRDSGYCNTPKGSELMEIRVECEKNKSQNWQAPDEIDSTSPVILRTNQDGYVNLPKQNKEFYKDIPSFMNPSYVLVEASKSDQEML